MKKVYLSALLAFAVIGSTNAQESFGGFPMSSKLVSAQTQKIANLELPAPNYDAIMQENNLREAKGIAGPFMVAQNVASNIDINKTGTWTFLENGERIWRLTVRVPGAKGIAFLYDKFNLPEGVRLFITSENGKQLLGAFTSENNNEYNNFANEPVLGSMAYLEMNIAAGVDINKILFHIDQVSAYYRGVEDMESVYGDHVTASTPARPTIGESAPCQVDANEALPNYAPLDYEMQKKASVKITIQSSGPGGTGLCSGTLINNSGNGTGGNCKTYVITASHCDGANSYEDAHYAQWLFRFKYRYDQGTTNLPDPGGTKTTAVGATFKSRSYYPSMPGGERPKMVGDFLLLEMKQALKSEWDGYLVGWNRNEDLAFDADYYDFFIGYHYPKGDVEKQSYGSTISATGTFNQTTVKSTHWYIVFTKGGTQPGSSGSGLFDKNGRLVGDLSGGTNKGCNGGHADYGEEGLYSKISYAWENEYDAQNHPRPAGQEAQGRLRDWLDPANTGLMQIGSFTPSCKTTEVNTIEHFGQNLEIYPNPSTNGIINVKTNFTEPTDLKIAVYNSLGKLVKEFSVAKAYTGNYSMDCGELANGVYMVKFTGAHTTTSKKVLIAR